MGFIPDLGSLKTQANSALDFVINFPKGIDGKSLTGTTGDGKFANDAFGRTNDSQGSVQYLMYPDDLLKAKDNEYGLQYVTFYINELVDSKVKLGGTYDDQMDDSTSAKSTHGGGYKTDNVSTASVTAVAAKNAIASVDVVGGAGVAALAVYTTTSTRATKKLKTAITLYSPNNFTTRYSADWSGVETANQQMMAAGLDAIGNTLASAFKPGDQQSVKALGATSMGSVANKALNDNKYKDIMSVQSGLAANNKKEMAFKGVDFRTFSFEYKFTPRSRDEYFYVQEIIKLFKFHMHPEYKEGSGKFLYVYPSEFDIVHYNANGINPNMPKHTTCILTSMSVNYTPNGQHTSFVGGAPTHIDVTLDFKELATLTKQEIKDGH